MDSNKRYRGRNERVLLFVETDDFGFLTHRIPMAVCAQGMGFDVHLGCRVSRYRGEIESLGVTVHPLEWMRRGPIRFWDEARLFWELSGLKRRVRPAVVQLVGIKPIALGLAVNLVAPAPTICTFAGLGSVFRGTGAPGWAPNVVGLAIRVGSKRRNVRAVVQNPEDAREVRTRFAVPQERIHLVEGSGVRSEDFVGRRPDRSSDAVSFVFAGRLIRDKGVNELLAAFQLVHSELPDVHLVLIGEADQSNPSSLNAEEMERARELDGVDLLGQIPQDEVRDVLASCDIAVLPSYGEGLPRFLLEAGATGLALIATDVPGCRSVVSHGETGLLVRPRSIDGLASAMLLVASDRESLERYGRNAQILVEERFDSTVITQEMAKVYASLMRVTSV